jgi:hypothetical protein
MHRPWVAPDLSFATQILGFDLDSAMRSGAEEYIRDTLSKYVEQRSLSDGSVGSAISSRMELEGMSRISVGATFINSCGRDQHSRIQEADSRDS